MDKIFPPFLANLKEHRLILPGEHVILALSGGKDSVSLALLLKQLQQEIEFSFSAAYFNHRLRPDAAREEDWVRVFCAGLGIELQSSEADVRGRAEREGLNLEHAASVSRYDFFQALARRCSAAKIATGHSRSDLLETFFIKLLRGSGLQGLSALYQRKAPSFPGKPTEEKTALIIRPLIIFSQEEILAFLARNGREFYQDSSNFSGLFLRNRIRHEMLPLLRQAAPDLEEKVFTTVSLMQDEFDFFQSRSRRILEQSLRLGAILPAAVFSGRHPAENRHLAREYLRLLKGDLAGISWTHVAEILGSLASATTLSLPGIDLRIEKGLLFPARFRDPVYRHQLPGPGSWFIPEIEADLELSISNAFIRPANHFSICLPVAGLHFPLTVRNAGRSDRYRKLNAPHRQSVFEMIRSAGAPSRLRGLYPLLVNSDDRIVWAYGCPPADDFKAGPAQPGPFLKAELKLRPKQ